MRFEYKYVFKNFLEFNFFKKNFFKKIDSFSSAYKSRIINNFYFDNELSESLLQNINGDYNKVKIRLRWYDKFEKKFFLEIKGKKGNYGFKKVHELESKTNRLEINFNKRLIDFVDLPTNLSVFSNLKCVSYNSYQREYYKSLKYGIRLTVDKNLSFCNIRINRSIYSKPYIILELKFPSENKFENQICKIVNDFNIDVSKFSKFSNSSVANNF